MCQVGNSLAHIEIDQGLGFPTCQKVEFVDNFKTRGGARTDRGPYVIGNQKDKWMLTITRETDKGLAALAVSTTHSRQLLTDLTTSCMAVAERSWVQISKGQISLSLRFPIPLLDQIRLGHEDDSRNGWMEKVGQNGFCELFY